MATVLLLIIMMAIIVTTSVGIGNAVLMYHQDKAKQLTPSQPKADPHRVWELERELGIIPADTPPPVSSTHITGIPRALPSKPLSRSRRGIPYGCSTCGATHYAPTASGAYMKATRCSHGRYTPSMQSAITYSARLQQPTPRPLSVPFSFSERVVPVHLSSGRIRYGYECNICNEMWIGDTVEETYKNSCQHRDNK